MALRAQSPSSQNQVSGTGQRLQQEPQAKAEAFFSELRAHRQERDSAEFIAEARRQSLAIAQSPEEAEDLDFIEAISMMVGRTER